MEFSKIAVFDFNHTLIDTNSDYYINKLIEEKDQFFQFPNEIENLYTKFDWTSRMNAAIEFMFDFYGVDTNRILECLKEIRIDDAMIKLLKVLRENRFELIILSDSNQVFIETILRENRVFELIDKIYTNPSYLDEANNLKIIPFNRVFNFNGEVFECDTQLCEKNMCKGTVLKRHLENYKKSRNKEIQIVYVGDGRNDFCPGLVLTERDFYFVKKKFPLDELLQNVSDLSKKLLSRPLFWNNARHIIDSLNLG